MMQVHMIGDKIIDLCIIYSRANRRLKLSPHPWKIRQIAEEEIYRYKRALVMMNIARHMREM